MCLQVQEEINPGVLQQNTPYAQEDQLCAVAPCEPKQAAMLPAMKSNLSPIWSATQAISQTEIKLYPNEGHT